MQQVDVVIFGDYILTMNERLEVIPDGAVAVHDKKILAVGSKDAVLKHYSSEKHLGGKGMAILPGLVNAHTHAAMVYFRGLADDLPLKEWLENHIWPAEGKLLSPEFVADATELACLEMVKAGITVYNDMYFFGESAAAATEKIGMRAILGAGIVDFPTVAAKNLDGYFENLARFVETWKGDELITPCVAPHSAYACAPETLLRAKKSAEQYDIPFHMHLSETKWEVDEALSRYGKRPVEHLASLGILDERVIAAHCVWVDEREIGLLAKGRVSVVHCIESNLKLASGIAPVPQMLHAGINVTFGTDGAASNNDLNILSELSTAAKVHKAVSNDPTVLDAKTALLMATRRGAEALGLGARIGSIEEGKDADIIGINIKKPHLTPLYDIHSHLVYSALASDVEMVLINGALILDGRQVLTCDEETVMQKAEGWAQQIARYNSKQ